MNVDYESRKRIAKKEAIKVVENLLKEVIQISDDEVTLEEPTEMHTDEKIEPDDEIIVVVTSDKEGLTEIVNTDDKEGKKKYKKQVRIL